mgnify:CR=1 FL=1
MLATIPGFGEQVFYRIISDVPDNVYLTLGTHLFWSGKLPYDMALHYGIECNVKRILSLELFHAVLSYAAEKYTGFQLLGTEKSDYRYMEFRVGAALHLLDRDIVKDTKITLISSTGYAGSGVFITAPLRARRILGLRAGFDLLQGRATFDDSHVFPITARSFYAGVSWTSLQTYKTWAVQYGKPAASRKFQISLDLLFMPDDAQIVALGGEAAKIGFRALFTAKSTFLSFFCEAGMKPGLAGNFYFSTGFGGKFSWVVKPLSIN